MYSLNAHLYFIISICSLFNLILFSYTISKWWKKNCLYKKHITLHIYTIHLYKKMTSSLFCFLHKIDGNTVSEFICSIFCLVCNVLNFLHTHFRMVLLSKLFILLLSVVAIVSVGQFSAFSVHVYITATYDNIKHL